MDINRTPQIHEKSILVRDLRIENVEDFYDGLPYRYNSIIDLIFQDEKTKLAFLDKLHLTNRLIYKVFTLSNQQSSLPILECLEIDGFLGGMLSTYLHDLDRAVIEGSGDISPCPQSKRLWEDLLDKSHFSFVFPSSQTTPSRTSEYMRKAGFREKRLDRLRYFFNGEDNGYLFRGVMQAFIDVTTGDSSLYSYGHDAFKEAKPRQIEIAEKYFLNVVTGESVKQEHNC